MLTVLGRGAKTCCRFPAIDFFNSRAGDIHSEMHVELASNETIEATSDAAHFR